MTKEEMLTYQGYLIKQILEVPIEEAFPIYIENFDILQDYNFIFPYQDGIDYGEKFDDLNLVGIDVINFFESNKLYCLNANSFISNMITGTYELHIASSVSLDTQIQSYLYRNLIDEKNSIPDNIAEIKKIIDSRKCLVDCMAYTLENTLFNPDFAQSKIYKDNMFAFEPYFFKNKMKAKMYAKRLLRFDKRLYHSDFSNWFKRQYLLYYLNLLVMADLYLNNKQKSTYDKELLMVKYFHDEIGVLCDREINLAKLLFTHGTKIKFFGKIQKGRNDIVNNLKNMTWDIFHLHNMINRLANVSRDIDFLIPFFITYDQRLKEITPIYKVKSAAYIKNGFNTHLNYLTDLIEPSIKHKYFVTETFLERQNRLKEMTEKTMIAKIQAEIDKYEKRL